MINEELTSSDTTVDELSKVSLRCATLGYPTPSITWRREDGKSLNLGQYGGKKIAGNLSFKLNIIINNINDILLKYILFNRTKLARRIFKHNTSQT